MVNLWDAFIQGAETWGSSAIIIRLTLAMLVGGLIGLDRGLKRRSAGVKTHALVCMGAALVMVTSQYINEHFGDYADLSRMGAQVISGVGFLGVGTIIVTGKNQIKGLTTAAGLWTCACVGLAIGIGFVEGALITLVLILIDFSLLSRVGGYFQRHAKVFQYYIEFENNRSMKLFLKEIRKRDMTISSLELFKSHVKGEGPSAVVGVESKVRVDGTELVAELQELEFIHYIEDL